MTFDLDIWHAVTTRSSLDQVQKSRSYVKVQGHGRKNVAKTGRWVFV